MLLKPFRLENWIRKFVSVIEWVGGEREESEWDRIGVCTYLVGFAFLIMVDDKAKFTTLILLSVLEIVVELQLVALYHQPRCQIIHFPREIL